MRSAITLLITILPAGISQTVPSIATYHNDVTRSGANLNETQLTLSSVTAGNFGKLFTQTVDGAVYAQPLYVPALQFNGTTHNVIFVATENNSIYAFDADTAGPALWKTNFNYGTSGATVGPVTSVDVNCGDLTPVVGITGTPVIDLSTNTIYAVSRTKEILGGTSKYYQHLHAVNILTGQEAVPRITIAASVPGSCGNVHNGNVVFDPLIQNQRAALLEWNHVIYIGWASHCDQGEYNGWLMGYDTRTQAQVAVLNTTPDDSTDLCKGGIWQSAGGPSMDSLGNMYAITGNGGFNANQGGHSYGNSLLKLSPSGTGALSVTDYFTPFNQSALNGADLDFGGSGTAIVLDDQPGPNPRLIVAAGKAGTIYLINRDKLGSYNSSSDQVVQSLAGAIGNGESAYPPPVYFQGRVYFGAAWDRVKGFQLTNGQLNPTPFASGPAPVADLGAGLSISAAPGGSNPILWALEGTAASGLLHAYNALTLAELYNTNQAAGGVDVPGTSVKFSVPTVVNGKVYVGTQNSLVVYGLLNHKTPAAPFGNVDTPQNNAAGIAGAISVTGWALGEAGIQSVAVWREPVANETPSSNGLVLVQAATMVPGTRPDVAIVYPGYPCNDCGWGTQILTNQLPNNNGQPGTGSGTYRLHVLATDNAGQKVDLGPVTIGVNNPASALPFGTIDTPTQGGTVSGTSYLNWGWTLTPQPNLIPVDGSTITVYIDGRPMGHPIYNNYRVDIANIFPGFQNSNGAVGVFVIDTTKLSNGLHTIAWSVTDGAGNSQGIGSRYFTVQN